MRRINQAFLSGALAAGLLLPSYVRAQVLDVYTNYDERISSRSTPSVQDIEGAFGAKTNIATGSLSFSVPVLSIPGNNGLDISVTYKMGLRNIGGSMEWYFEEDEPYLSGTFSDSAGWTTQLGGASRCSNTGAGSTPPNVPSSNGRPGTFYANEYWSGYFLSHPGGGGRLNKGGANPGPPTSGGPYYWSTDNLWYFSCTPLLVGVGEGFIGHSPDGLKYFFNTMRDGLVPPILQKHNVVGQEIELERRDIRIYASRVEDRFGNYVTGLTASDGRNVLKTVSGSTVTYTYGSRQWIVKTSSPFSVIYPDGSSWSATITGNIYDYISLKEGSCPGDRRSLSPSTTTATIKSASGATGSYTLKQVLIGYSYVAGQCLPLDEGGSTVDRPSVMISPSLVQRTVSGPGLTTQTLNIDYGPSNDCYSNSVYWSPKCTSSSPTRRIVTYSYSDGRYKRYSFGNRDAVDADLLLKLEEGLGASSPQRTTEYGYSLMPSIGGFVGSTLPLSVGDWKRTVLVTKTIVQEGRKFSWAVPSNCGAGTALCVDAYGRPTKVVKSSAPLP